MTLRKIFVAFVAMIFIQSAQAQVSKIKYLLKFNEQTNLFDCYMVVKEGQAVSVRDRAQFNAQYTIMVPSGSTVDMQSSQNPIQGNQQYNGVRPTQWVVSNVVRKPEADPANDYISVAPSLAPAAFYNDLKSGEEIKLFSLKISPVTACGANIKIFDNGQDLNSGARGMGGGDFSNGFTMGGIGQKYGGNEVNIIPSTNVIQDVKVNQNKGIQIESKINTDSPYAPYHVAFIGPKSFYSEASSISIANPSKDNYGKYKLVVTDQRGCQDVKEIEVQDKNQTVKDVVKAFEAESETKNISQSAIKLNTAVIENVSLYPNPATTNLIVNIAAGKGAKVRGDILDINGRIISSNVINKIIESKDEVFELSVLDLYSGIYTLSVNIDGKDTAKKFMVLK